MVSPELIVIKRWTSKQFTVLAVVILLVLLLFAGSGYLYGIKDAIRLKNENQQLLNSLAQMASDVESGKRQLVMQKQISKVDQAANFHAGNSMDSQLQQIRRLERELKFFRSIVAPEEAIKGLQIARFNWHQLESGNFSWQLSLLQAGSQGSALSGIVRIKLVAMRGEEQVIVPLTNEEHKDHFSYRFKYFQHLTGTITIADDLVPISINVVAKPAINGQQSIEKQFPWQPDEEKLANVG